MSQAVLIPSTINLVEKTVSYDKDQFMDVEHYCWRDIDEDLGNDAWIIGRKNSGIRNYGFLRAYKGGADIIITLDDDCFPAESDFVAKHIDNIQFNSSVGWHATYPNPLWMYTRGFPYAVRDKVPTMVSHGLWSGDP